jgi:hypothetical protein
MLTVGIMDSDEESNDTVEFRMNDVSGFHVYMIRPIIRLDSKTFSTRHELDDLLIEFSFLFRIFSSG